MNELSAQSVSTAGTDHASRPQRDGETTGALLRHQQSLQFNGSRTAHTPISTCALPPVAVNCQ